jgi:hypothetical protein
MTGFEHADIDLARIVPALCDGTISDRDTAEFVRLCVRLSIATLMYLQSRGYHIFEAGGGAGGRGFEDKAADAVADLFERDGDGIYVRFRRYFTPYMESAGSHAEWLVLLRRLVTRRVQQALSRVFRERDPEGAKLHRGLKMAAVNHGRWTLDAAFGRQWIRLDHGFVRSETGVPRLRLLEDSRLTALACGRFRPQDTLPVILDRLSDFLLDHPEVSDRIELKDAVKLVREFRRGTGRRAEGCPSETPLSPDLIHAVESVREGLVRKIERDYRTRGKLDDRCSEGFRLALSDMVDDLLGGDPPGPYFEYLRVHLPDLDEARYRAELRTKFEYMAKLLKQRVVRAVSIF